MVHTVTRQFSNIFAFKESIFLNLKEWVIVLFLKSAEQLGAFAAGVKQMLEDVQERLVYRTHIYIQTDIIGYKPAPGDLAYPDKLVMMEVGSPY